MRNAQWIRVREKGFRAQQKAKVEGVDVTLLASPYDVPEAVRGVLDEATGRFVVEIRYLQDEAWRREPVGDHVTLRIGESSGRIHGVEIDVDALEADFVAFSMSTQNALRSVSQASNAHYAQVALDQTLRRLHPGFLSILNRQRAPVHAT